MTSRLASASTSASAVLSILSSSAARSRSSVLGDDDMGARYLQAVGRGGVLVTDNVLVFGAAGVGD